jgi:hypothetical protein
MVGSYLLQMNLRSGCRSTSVGAGHGLGEGQDGSGRGGDNDNANGESHEAPLLGPPMTHAEMMAEMLAACRESARALKMLAQAIGGFTRGGPGGNGGNGVVPAVSRGPIPTKTSWGH